MRYFFCNHCRTFTSSDSIDFNGWKCGRCQYTLDPYLVVSVVGDDQGRVRCASCPNAFSIRFSDTPFCAACRGTLRPRVEPPGTTVGPALKRQRPLPAEDEEAIEIVHGFPLALLPTEVLIVVVLHLNDASFLDVRRVNRAFCALARDAARLAIPFPSQARFLSATAPVFQDFSKQASSVTIGRREAFREGWRLYASIQVRASPAYLELFNEKYVLFNNRVRQQLGPVGRLLDPQRWTPEINDAWILGHIHRQHPFRLLADPTFFQNFWDAIQARPTALGREIWQILQAGYRPTHAMTLGDDLSGSGIVLLPPAARRSPAILEDAQGATQAELGNRLAAVAAPGFVPAQNTTGRKRWCPRSGCTNEVSLLWKKGDAGKWRAVYTCSRHGTV